MANNSVFPLQFPFTFTSDVPAITPVRSYNVRVVPSLNVKGNTPNNNINILT